MHYVKVYYREYGRKIPIICMIFILLFSVLSIPTTADEPVIVYFDVRPHVQTRNGYVNITCIATDYIIIKTVEVNITDPYGISEMEQMTELSDGEYTYGQAFEEPGKYIFFIRVEDNTGNYVETSNKTFWIAEDADDRDNDGMPDWWEEKYNLDPEDPTDADDDIDGDEYTNLKEYEIGTNPLKNIFTQNVAYRVRNNIWYLAGSTVLFLLIVILSIYGKRRR